jgi:Geminivirus rep protein central domain
LDASSREEFFARVKQADPKNFVLQHEHLEYFANKHFAPPTSEYTPQFTDFMRVPQAIRD